MSFVTDLLLADGDARVESDAVLLQGNFLLVKHGILSLQEVDLVNVRSLKLQVVFLEVRDVFDHFLQDVIGRLSRVVHQSSALTPQQLNFFLVLVELLKSGFRPTLHPLLQSRKLTSIALTLFLMAAPASLLMIFIYYY